MVRYSFPVRLFHSLLHAGLSRRSGCPGLCVCMGSHSRNKKNPKNHSCQERQSTHLQRNRLLLQEVSWKNLAIAGEHKIIMLYTA
jgi:hypothetical protein